MAYALSKVNSLNFFTFSDVIAVYYKKPPTTQTLVMPTTGDFTYLTRMKTFCLHPDNQFIVESPPSSGMYDWVWGNSKYTNTIIKGLNERFTNFANFWWSSLGDRALFKEVGTVNPSSWVTFIANSPPLVGPYNPSYTSADFQDVTDIFFSFLKAKLIDEGKVTLNP